MFKIDAADYMMSICGSAALRELSSPGKSGSVFYLSQDDRFMIKTLRKPEVQKTIKLYCLAGWAKVTSLKSKAGVGIRDPYLLSDVQGAKRCWDFIQPSLDQGFRDLEDDHKALRLHSPKHFHFTGETGTKMHIWPDKWIGPNHVPFGQRAQYWEVMEASIAMDFMKVSDSYDYQNGVWRSIGTLLADENGFLDRHLVILADQINDDINHVFGCLLHNQAPKALGEEKLDAAHRFSEECDVAHWRKYRVKALLKGGVCIGRREIPNINSEQQQRTTWSRGRGTSDRVEVKNHGGEPEFGNVVSMEKLVEHSVAIATNYANEEYCEMRSQNVEREDKGSHS
eukprot:Gb_03046 [translate_table: standard]